MWRGICPDKRCRSLVTYMKSDLRALCRKCGQYHKTKNLINSYPFDKRSYPAGLPEVFLHNEGLEAKRSACMVQVEGISNYHDKLLSHLITYNGLDRQTDQTRSIFELTGKNTLDCSSLGDKTFRIETDRLGILGYGRDQTGSTTYLADTLNIIKQYNSNTDVLVPLHADGDGHCLVHAVSRALSGRELFWHPLRIGLKEHFQTHIEEYKNLLGDFISDVEWISIIEECDPEYTPSEPDDGIGLRNIHICGLANILGRAILLLDNMCGTNTAAEYSALFLPGLSTPAMCCTKKGVLNPPICIAWSNAARNHFIPLVPIKEKPLPKFPRHLLPNVWGFPQELLDRYIKFDANNLLTIGGVVCLQDSYLLKLTGAMDELFIERYGCSAELAADVYHSNTPLKMAGASFAKVIEITGAALQDNRLRKCLSCGASIVVPVAGEWLRPGGKFYLEAKTVYGLEDQRLYTFDTSTLKVTCVYDAIKDLLVLKAATGTDMCFNCRRCNLRPILSDGSIAYQNGDVTSIPVSSPRSNKCPCGYKHWWNGQLYDNAPHHIPVQISWNDKVIYENIDWFQFESEPDLNSNVYHVTSAILQKHFPGEFESKPIHKRILSQIQQQIEEYLCDPSYHPSWDEEEETDSDESFTSASSDPGLFRKRIQGSSPAVPPLRLPKAISPPVGRKSKNKSLPTSSVLTPKFQLKVHPSRGYTSLMDEPMKDNYEAISNLFQSLYKDSPPEGSSPGDFKPKACSKKTGRKSPTKMQKSSGKVFKQSRKLKSPIKRKK